METEISSPKRYHRRQRWSRTRALLRDQSRLADKPIKESVVDHRASGVAMSYRDLGEGDPLVLLHAFPLNGRMFKSQMRAFSGSHRVVAPDYPGFGRSPRTPAQPD